MSANLSATVARRAAAAALVATLAIAAGCADRNSIIVGSIPDDYRTNHPIVISERDVGIDIPVGMSDRGLNRVQRTAVDGFMSRYDRDAQPTVTVMVPSGSANAGAASHVAAGIVKRMRASGVKDGRILHQLYDAAGYGENAPIRLTYPVMRASTGPCGRWPADLLDTTDNKHYANFGCAYQNNLAAQIANPADLLGPRRSTEIDAQNRSNSITVYQERGISEEFVINSEINY
jgi:pilus assembly protein CpaD